MMSYEVFKNVVVNRFKDFLPDELKDCQVNVRTVRKVNQTMDCINLVSADGNLKASPNIYVDELYKEFQKKQDLNQLLRKTAVTTYYAMKSINPEIAKLDFSEWTNNIVINLINTEDNRELLEELPHREVLDLSVIYRFIMGQNGSGLATVRVDNGLMKEIGLTEDELFQLALKNTRRMFPTVTEPLEKAREMAKGKVSEEEYNSVPLMDETMQNQIQFMTNSLHLHGATSLLYEDELFALSEKMKASFYVMPSSVHEVVAVSEVLGEPHVLQMMLQEANKEEFVGVDKLSDRIYFYNRNERTLSFAC